MTLKRKSLQGLTLVELLVVLSILAVLSTVAIRSVSDQAIETRYDANLDQLEAIKEAIIGDGDDFNGFVGDVGRLPEVLNNSLDELLEQNGIEPFGIQTPSGDSELRLVCGWRGPYLDLGFVQDSLIDGFGQDYDLLQDDGTTSAANGDEIGIIRTLGQGGTLEGTLYEQDASIVLENTTTSETNWAQDILVTVVVDDPTSFIDEGEDELVVRVYGPGENPDSSGTEFGYAKTLDQKDETLIGTQTIYNFSFNVPNGRKVIRAYVIATVPSNDEENLITSTPPPRSKPGFIVVDKYNKFITLEL